MRRDPRRSSRLLKTIYEKLFRRFGRQYWWPGETSFEIIVGAILTQNTNWGNVEKAIRNLKEKGILYPYAFYKIPPRRLAALIKPAGSFNVKTKRLKNFMRFLFEEYEGDLSRMKKEKWQDLRRKLLSVNGIGPETADSILLYALEKPVFVVDAYTKRVLYRHNFISNDMEYHDIQDLMMRSFKRDIKLFNEYHALIVRLGKDHCKPSARCEKCPLRTVEYSLKYKCVSCHRALTKEERSTLAKRSPYYCSHCQR